MACTLFFIVLSIMPIPVFKKGLVLNRNRRNRYILQEIFYFNAMFSTKAYYAVLLLNNQVIMINVRFQFYESFLYHC